MPTFQLQSWFGKHGDVFPKSDTPTMLPVFQPRFSCTEFLNKRFANSHRKAGCLMAIHETLAHRPKHESQPVGWSEATELLKVARKMARNSSVQPWHKAKRNLPKRGFKNAVDRHRIRREPNRGRCVAAHRFAPDQCLISLHGVRRVDVGTVKTADCGSVRGGGCCNRPR